MDENPGSLALDMNGDGRLTITDLVDAIVYLALAPGDYVLGWLIANAPALAEFLELDASAYGGALSISLSVVLWLLALIALGVAYSSVRRFDTWLTAQISRLGREALRRVRILRIRVVSSLARVRRIKAAASTVSVAAVVLDEFEEAVLRCHAAAQAFEVLTARETASRVSAPRRRVEPTLDKLKRLCLVERGFGTDEGEPGYRITQAGQLYLMER